VCCRRASGAFARLSRAIISPCCTGLLGLHASQETKLKSPDYKDAAESAAVADFLRRIKLYESIYQPITDEHEGHLRYIKLIDVGRQMIANRAQGLLNTRMMMLLGNINITPPTIFLSRHGESQFNVQGRIGGDSLLSPRGQQYSLKLAAFMKGQFPPGTDLTVWTSTLKRTQVTAGPIGE